MSALAERLAHRLEATRARTFTLLEPLGEEGLARQPDPIMSPPLWDLGHIAAYEELWLVTRLTGQPSLHPELQATYDAFETPRAVRGDASILAPAAARDYLRRVRERALAALGRADLDDDAEQITAGGFVFDMIAQHEAQHTETVLQALKLLPPGGYRPPRAPTPVATNGSGSARTSQAPATPVAVPGGTFPMGAPAGGFAYDCERPRHERTVAPFLIARHPVTNGEHLAFMADDGYARQELWTPAGWGWRTEGGVEHPLYWESDGEGGWAVRSYDRREPVDPLLPVQHVSAHEADAYARWAGARLPSEAEWERAAAMSPDPRVGANLDQLAFGPAPCHDGAGAGPVGMLGDVWEWTASGFDGYPGFRPFPYREYAGVFFGGPYRVLRGGSWATQAQAARATFRNWDLPQRRQIFSGFRLAWDMTPPEEPL